MLTVLVPVGTAIIGALAGVAGTYWIMQRREASRRGGILSALILELTDSAVKAQSLAVNRASSMHTFSDAVYKQHQAELGEFLPIHLHMELMNRYQELESMQRFRDDLLEGRDPQCAARDLTAWSERMIKLQRELLALPDASRIRANWPEALDRLRGAKEALSPGGTVQSHRPAARTHNTPSNREVKDT
jgi:hypothetical protein